MLWEVWRALKASQLLLTMAQATLMLFCALQTFCLHHDPVLHAKVISSPLAVPNFYRL